MTKKSGANTTAASTPKPKRKLTLGKQTLRDLDGASVTKIKGGQITNTTGCCNIVTK